MNLQQSAVDVQTPPASTVEWLHYWSQEKQATWKSIPVGALPDLKQSQNPRYVTILATTITDDPATREGAQYWGPLVIDLDRKNEQGGKAAAILHRFF